ncbi:MAG: carboxypeptidase-like regulatory domain-containing protein, partial [Saprospiraceae bacterium]|nr:carboxypeptidase-like regulatory domain-containing protein [Saprospiraceae bacterium]
LYVLLISASSAWAMAQPALALSTLTVPEANLLSGAIEGVVRDAETGEGLPLVNIQLGDSRHGTSTQFDGAFKLSGLAPGNYRLQATYIGYQDGLLEEVEVIEGQTTTLELTLEPMAILTEEVVVTATLKPQAVKLAPASIALITSKEIRERNITTF